mgnify:CR=1 FL=1
MAVAAVYAEEFEVALLKLAVYAVGQCLWIWIEPLMVFKVLLYAGPAEPLGEGSTLRSSSVTITFTPQAAKESMLAS